MNANELRIGSYYNFEGRPIKLDGSFLAVYLQNKISLCLEPIKLTEQWLLDFGYTQKESFYRINSSRFVEVIIHDGGIDVCNHSVCLSHIKHVHQLQNLYFSLTGIELIKKI